MCFVSCNGQTEHTHKFGEWDIIKPATPTEQGEKARYCSCGERQSESFYYIFDNQENKDVITVVDGYLVVNGVKTEYKVYSDPVISVIEGYVAVNGVKTEYPVALGCSHMWQTVTTAPTCTAGGYETMTCILCDKSVKVNETDKLDHVYSTRYSFDNDCHWSKCFNCEATIGPEYHTVNENGECSTCGIPVDATPGVIYDISADGTYAEVVGYEGTSKKVKIAEEYKGVPVKSIYKEAFYFNEIIDSVIIPDSVTTIGDRAFCGCYDLASIILGENVEAIGSQAFYSSGLESIHFPKSLVNISMFLAFGDQLASITVDDDNPIYTSIDGNLYSKDGSILVKYAIGKRDTTFTIPSDVLEIGDYAFESADYFRTVIIPDGVITIGHGAFNSCHHLTNIVIPNSVTDIGDSAFLNCNSLVYNEYENGRYLGNSENPYFALVGVTKGTLSSYKIHEKTKIISGAFDDCSRLVSLVIPDGVTAIGYRYTFYDCDSLIFIVVPKTVTKIGYNVFTFCDNLTDIYFTGSKTEWEAIEKGDIPYNITVHFNYNPKT